MLTPEFEDELAPFRKGNHNTECPAPLVDNAAKTCDGGFSTTSPRCDITCLDNFKLNNTIVCDQTGRWVGTALCEGAKAQ